MSDLAAPDSLCSFPVEQRISVHPAKVAWEAVAKPKIPITSSSGIDFCVGLCIQEPPSQTSGTGEFFRCVGTSRCVCCVLRHWRVRRWLG